MTDSIADNSLDFLGNAPYVVIALLVLMALYSMLTQKNLIKICIAATVLGSSVSMFLVLPGYRHGGSIPVHNINGAQESITLPTPQCFALTSMVIALATTALMLSLVILINKHYGTLDVDEVRRLKG